MLIGIPGYGGLTIGRHRHGQGGPLAVSDGIVCTPTVGLVDAADFIASLVFAFSFTADMDLRQLVSASPEGSAIAGIVNLPSGLTQSFVIHIAPTPCAGDAEVTAILANFETSCS